MATEFPRQSHTTALQAEVLQSRPNTRAERSVLVSVNLSQRLRGLLRYLDPQPFQQTAAQFRPELDGRLLRLVRV
jgi:hypothetical protein